MREGTLKIYHQFPHTHTHTNKPLHQNTLNEKVRTVFLIIKAIYASKVSKMRESKTLLVTIITFLEL